MFYRYNKIVLNKIEWAMKKLRKWLALNMKVVVFSFFIAYFALGLAIVGDYGISTDEPTERETSLRQYQFAFSKIFFLFTKQQAPGLEHDYVWYQNWLQGSNEDRFYGTFLQWPTVALEHWRGFDAANFDPETIYFSRHLLNFIYFYLGLLCFYSLLKQRFKKGSLALLGTLIIVLTPRFFAEAFYNNKDILFAVFYIITIYFSEKFMRQKSWLNFFLLSVVTAIAANTRIVVGLVALVYWFEFLSEFFWQKGEFRWKKMTQLLTWPVFTFLLYILIHPTAWGQEVGFIWQVIQSFSQYDAWQGKTLYFGNFVPWNKIPWHYTLGYLWATIPLTFSGLIIYGILVWIKNFYLSLKNKTEKLKVKIFTLDNKMFFFWLAPLLMVIVCQSVLYNSWRHLYFIYFPLVYLAILGLSVLEKKNKTQAIIFFLLAITFILTSFWMIENHPYEGVYYNPLIRKSVTKNFERDYWGLSIQPLFNQVLQLEATSEERIKIWQNDPMHKFSSWLVPVKIREKFLLTSQEEAQYAVINFYNWNQTTLIDNKYYDNLNKTERNFSQWQIIDQIKVDGYPIAILLKNLESTNEANLVF